MCPSDFLWHGCAGQTLWSSTHPCPAMSISKDENISMILCVWKLFVKNRIIVYKVRLEGSTKVHEFYVKMCVVWLCVALWGAGSQKMHSLHVLWCHASQGFTFLLITHFCIQLLWFGRIKSHAIILWGELWVKYTLEPHRWQTLLLIISSLLSCNTGSSRWKSRQGWYSSIMKGDKQMFFCEGNDTPQPDTYSNFPFSDDTFKYIFVLN